MKLRLTDIFYLIQGAIFAQKHMVIKDADTHRPLPYATAECFARQWGSYSDSVGRMILPDSIWNNCSLVFSFVGYATKTVNLSPQLQEVFLTKLQHILDDIVLKPCTNFLERKLEVRSKQTNFGFGYTSKAGGDFWATYVPNPTGKKGVIKTFSYGAKYGNTDAPVRLRFFQLDTSTGLPSVEITTEPIIIVPGRSGWITEDISRYRIIVPGNGIVAAFEMFDAGSQYHYKTTVRMSDKTKRVAERYGWTIRGMHSPDIIGFGKRPGTSWFNLNPRNRTGAKMLTAAPQVGISMRVCSE